jgi:hypothetical protein
MMGSWGNGKMTILVHLDWWNSNDSYTGQHYTNFQAFLKIKFKKHHENTVGTLGFYSLITVVKHKDLEQSIIV